MRDPISRAERKGLKGPITRIGDTFTVLHGPDLHRSWQLRLPTGTARCDRYGERTGTGVKRWVVVPSPICPRALFPQQYQEPPAATAQVLTAPPYKL